MARRFRVTCIASFLLVTAFQGLAPASPRQRVPVAERTRGARHVVVASVADVQPRFERNRFGDQLIVSRVRLRIDESLKGPAAREVVMDVEGGTIGDLTLSVSDLPALKPGERGVFFLEQIASGTFRPHRRGLGIMKLSAGDQILEENLRLSDLRAEVRAAAQ
ncbi:MAG: hypothetical protein AB7I50_07830 [Vicinamibacterales bacterium]